MKDGKATWKELEDAGLIDAAGKRQSDWSKAADKKLKKKTA